MKSYLPNRKVVFQCANHWFSGAMLVQGGYSDKLLIFQSVPGLLPPKQPKLRPYLKPEIDVLRPIMFGIYSLNLRGVICHWRVNGCPQTNHPMFSVHYEMSSFGFVIKHIWNSIKSHPPNGLVSLILDTWQLWGNSNPSAIYKVPNFWNVLDVFGLVTWICLIICFFYRWYGRLSPPKSAVGPIVQGLRHRNMW